MNKPNFLIIITDQWHPGCLGYAGHPVVCTPNIDRLAKSGMTFSRMYSSTPMCMPQRATLFTGQTPRMHGVRMNGISLDPAIPTFTEALRQAGYRTHCCGKIHLSTNGTTKNIGVDANTIQFPENREKWMNDEISKLPSPYYGLETTDFFGGCAHSTFGDYLNWLKKEHPDQVEKFQKPQTLTPPSPAMGLFNRNSYKWALPANLHPAAWTADRTIDYLEKSDKEQPFMLMCSFQEPHPPFAPPEPYCNKYDPSDVSPAVEREGELDDLPPHFQKMVGTDIVTSGNNGQPMNATKPYRNECAAHYYGLIEMVDDQVGRVMDALEANDQADNTVVLFFADHGEALGDHGLWSKGPYHFDSVIRVPFIAAWPGKIAAGSHFDGPSSLLDFAPTILDIANVDQPQGMVPEIPEAPNAPPPMPGRSLKKVMLGKDTNEETDALVEMDEDYLGTKLRTLVTKRWRITCYAGQDYGELFDLQNDPNELHNLWAKKEYQTTKTELKIRLLEKLISTDRSLPRQMGRA